MLCRNQGRLRTLVLVAATVYSALAVHVNVQRYLIDLHRAEMQVIDTALEQTIPPGARAVGIVRPAHANRVSGATPATEYGMPDTALSQAYARVAVQQLYSERRPGEPLPEVIQCAEPATRDCPDLRERPGLPVIDMPRGLALRYGLSTVPR